MIVSAEVSVKKIAVFNLNVGSAIEYAGDIIISWLKELEYDVSVYTLQTEPQHTLMWLCELEPDLIVLNEDHHRPLVVTYLYRAMRNVPVIYVDHVWGRIVDWAYSNVHTEAEQILQMWYRMTLDTCEHIFCLNNKPWHIEWPEHIAHKISNRYYPTDDSIFRVQTPWSDRPKMFGYFGNIIPHKLSLEFLEKIVVTDLVVDCYGKDCSTNDGYVESFSDAIQAGNINYYGLADQDKMTEIMNEYKYFVMPHYGYEPFNWVLKQCAHCGTIPLIVNDKNSTKYNGKWVEWADGLYMGCDTVDDFLVNLQKLNTEQPDHSKMSDYISKAVRIQFPYKEFKKEFQNKARELLNG